MKSLRIVRAKPNPTGKDRYGAHTPPAQLAAEWVDFTNDGTEPLLLEGISLHHVAYQPGCRERQWNTLMTFTGVLPVGRVVRVHSGDQLAQMHAEDARRLLDEHVIEKPPVPVDAIARKLGAEIRYIPFQGKGEISGMLFRQEAGHAVIGVNSLHHQNRQRFTIAHEIAHLLLHKGKELHVDKTIFINYRDDVSSQAVDTDEIEANQFAADLLMPKQMILADVEEAGFDLENEEDLLNLARRYRVSIQALTFRLANLGLISLPENPGGRR